jgi:uncharacterized RDD family membrane protein YckC
MESNLNQEQFAGLWLRAVAGFIDTLILFVGFIVISALISIMIALIQMPFLLNKSKSELENISSDNSGIIIMTISIIIFFIFSCFYFAKLESSKKQGSLGKMAVGIKVTDLMGKNISFKNAYNRRLFVILNNLTIGIGIIMIAFNKKNQALHDIWASTLVVKKYTCP